jgi:putative transposase
MEDEHSFPTRRSIRLKGVDYSQPGIYFATICAYSHRSLFGEIKEGQVCLSKIGRIVEECWLEIPCHFLGVELHSHVVMPNHVHGVLAILPRARRAVPLRDERSGERVFGKPLAGSLPTIIGSFKSAVTKRAGAIVGSTSGRIWQRGYYERVVRAPGEYAKIIRYIGWGESAYLGSRRRESPPDRDIPTEIPRKDGVGARHAVP